MPCSCRQKDNGTEQGRSIGSLDPAVPATHLSPHHREHKCLDQCCCCSYTEGIVIAAACQSFPGSHGEPHQQSQPPAPFWHCRRGRLPEQGGPRGLPTLPAAGPTPFRHLPQELWLSGGGAAGPGAAAAKRTCRSSACWAKSLTTAVQAPGSQGSLWPFSYSRELGPTGSGPRCSHPEQQARPQAVLLGGLCRALSCPGRVLAP